ncbi:MULTISPECIES: hypothetical protein [Streptomyces]|uniref:hypothetical protein n=1 Tax=Streptomyces TaxID=1883 RepID=UPI002E1555E9|nr:hypothetical protein OG772_36445 [Streptomyces sp. NBC_01321]
MFQETPIYNRLIDEQGDIPAQVRGEAQRLGRELERVIQPARRPDFTAQHDAWQPPRI